MDAELGNYDDYSGDTENGSWTLGNFCIMGGGGGGVLRNIGAVAICGDLDAVLQLRWKRMQTPACTTSDSLVLLGTVSSTVQLSVLRFCWSVD